MSIISATKLNTISKVMHVHTVPMLTLVVEKMQKEGFTVTVEQFTR